MTSPGHTQDMIGRITSHKEQVEDGREGKVGWQQELSRSAEAQTESSVQTLIYQKARRITLSSTGTRVPSSNKVN